MTNQAFRKNDSPKTTLMIAAALLMLLGFIPQNSLAEEKAELGIAVLDHTFVAQNSAERLVMGALQASVPVTRIPYFFTRHDWIDLSDKRHYFDREIEGRPHYILHFSTGDILIKSSQYAINNYTQVESVSILAVNSSLSNKTKLSDEIEAKGINLQRQIEMAQKALDFSRDHAQTAPDFKLGIRRVSFLESIVRKTVDPNYTTSDHFGEIGVVVNKSSDALLQPLLIELASSSHLATSSVKPDNRFYCKDLFL